MKAFREIGQMLTLAFLAMFSSQFLTTTSFSQTPNTSETDSGKSLDAQIGSLLQQITAAQDQGNWSKTLELVDRVEVIFDGENIWDEMEAVDRQSVRRNFAIWRADALRETGRFKLAKTQYLLGLGFMPGSNDDGEMEAVASSNLALILRQLGENDQALDLFKKAQRWAKQKYGEESQDNATALLNIGITLDSLGLYLNADRFLSQAIEVYKKSVGSDHIYTALALSNRATTATNSGRFNDAHDLFVEALQKLRISAGENHEYTAAAYTGLATTLIYMGRHHEATNAARKSLASWQASKGADFPSTTIARNNLATILLDQNQPDQAEPYLQDALTSSIEIFGRNHPQTAKVASNLGNALFRMGQRQEGIAVMQSAIEWANAALGASHPDIGLYKNNLGGMLSATGNFEGARQNIEAALEIINDGQSGPHPRRIIAVSNLALLEFQSGQKDIAENRLRNILEEAKSLPGTNRTRQLLPLNGLTMVLAEKPDVTDETLDFSRQAIDIVMERRERSLNPAILPTGNARQVEVGSDVRLGIEDATTFEFHMDLLSRRLKSVRSDKNILIDEMFVTAQQNNVSAAAKAMSQSAARTASGSGLLAELVRSQQDLMRTIQSEDKRLEQALIEGSSDRVAEIQNLLVQLTANLADVNAKLSSGFPEFLDLVQPGALSVTEVQKRLGEKDSLLLIMPVLDDLFVMAVTQDDISWSRQANVVEKVKMKIQRLRCQIDPQGCAEDFFADEEMSDAELEGYQAYDREAAYYLYQQLVEPVAELLKDKDHIYVVSNGALATLPLAALVSEKPAPGDNADPSTLAQTKWLGQNYAFTSLPAVSALRGKTDILPQDRSNQSPGDWEFSGFGAPALEGPDDNDGQRRGVGSSGFFRAAGSTGLSLANAESLKKLIPLPGTDRELEAMAKVLDAGMDSIVTGTAATETAVRTSARLSDSQVVIFATHGLLPEELDGLNEPALVFTPPEQSTPLDDGVLSASEATELKLDARWVILSACNTATAEGQGGGDSLSSLSRAFLYAGAKSLLASNWRVGDEETAILTVETIKADRAAPDQGRAIALKEAMLAVRTGKRVDGSQVPNWKPEWVHPASWASFIHISSAR